MVVTFWRRPMLLRRALPIIVVLGSSLFAAGQTPVFRSRVNLVEVDAVVTDAGGRPVTDLRQDEFQIFEDGRPRDIVSFIQVKQPAPSPHAPEARDVTTNVHTNDGRLIFLILDDLHTPRERTTQVKTEARRLIERLGPHDQVAVLWTSTRQQGAREFSTNHAAVMQSIDRFEALSSRIGRRNPSELGLPTIAYAEGGLDESARDLAALNVQGMFERARPVIMIREVCNYLAAIGRRRKALVYVGQGPSGRLFTPDAQSGIDVELDVIRAMTAARRANVAMYSIGAAGSVPVDPESVPLEQDLHGIPDTLGAFSRQTGGFASTASAGNEAVDRIITETGSYYLLGYYADPPAGSPVKSILTALAGNPWHGFRSIDVRSTRPGVAIRARRGYWAGDLGDAPAPSTTAKARDAVSRAVSGLLPEPGLELRAFVAPFGNTGRKGHDVAVAVEVASPAFAKGAANASFADRTEFVVVAVEPGGKVRLTNRVTAQLRLGPGKAVSLAAGRYLLCTRLSLPAGSYQLRIGVRSEAAGHSGSVYTDLTVPDFSRAHLSLSGLVLDQRVSSTPRAVGRADTLKDILPFTPSLLRGFEPSDSVWAYVRAYRAAGTGDGRVQMLATISRAGADTPVWSTAGSRPAVFGPRNEVEYRVRLPLDRLASGNYRLRVTAALPGEPPLAGQELAFTMGGAEDLRQTRSIRTTDVSGPRQKSGSGRPISGRSTRRIRVYASSAGR